jgi:hypothetical protein
MIGLLAACSEAEPPAAVRAPEETPLVATEFPTRPNIILLMSDDQGWGDTGFNGHPVIRTPNIDGLASRGMSFGRFYAAAPVCCRAGLQPDPRQCHYRTAPEAHGHRQSQFR